MGILKNKKNIIIFIIIPIILCFFIIFIITKWSNIRKTNELQNILVKENQIHKNINNLDKVNHIEKENNIYNVKTFIKENNIRNNIASEVTNKNKLKESKINFNKILYKETKTKEDKPESRKETKTKEDKPESRKEIKTKEDKSENKKETKTKEDKPESRKEIKTKEDKPENKKEIKTKEDSKIEKKFTERLDKKTKVRHNKILINEKGFQRIKNQLKTDTNIKKWFSSIKNKNDKLLNKNVIEYRKKDGYRLDITSTSYIVDLSFMYKITNNEKYAFRAWEEIENVINYPDWNEEHFLDSCMFSYGLSVGYDWLYDYLSINQKKIIKETLINRVLKKGLEYYKNNSHFFVTDKYNWNLVCNTGLILGALSIDDDKTQICKDIINEGLKSIKNGIIQYTSEGDSIEGVSYWDYGTKFLTYFLSTIDISTNKINDYIDIDGIKKTAEFPMYMTGKCGAYNYSDNDLNYPIGYINLWFAKKLNKPQLTWYHKYYLNNGGSASIYDLLWYESSLYKQLDTPLLDKSYKKQAVTTMRSNWYDKNSGFVGCKGGQNGAPHGDLDVGSFVFDFLGERWAIDLGKENYNLSGYWDRSNKGLRYKYYRKKAEGHNTLLINPSTDFDQKIDAYCPIIENKLNNNNPFVIIDMTNAYKDSISLTRKFKFKNRKSLFIEDNFKLKKESEIVWQMHTKAYIEIINNKTLKLMQNDKMIEMKILNNEDYKFEVVEAKPDIKSINLSNQTENKGVKKIIIKLVKKDGNIKVLINN